MPDASIEALLGTGAALIDLRAPVEFAKGSVPGALNLPILTDAERHRVGLCYRQDGAAAAERLGLRLVAGAIKAARVDGWQQLLERHANAALFCWRGGLRTATASRWLQERGLQPACVVGGYKAIRRRCLEILDQDSQGLHWLSLGGRTGVGKTQVLNTLASSIDLEGRAAHRGSAFGATNQPQPSQADFENQLAVDALRLASRSGLLLLEDESRTIGRVALPESWHRRLQSAPLVLLEADPEQRAAHIAQEYVHAPLSRGTAAELLAHKYQRAINRISKRLGGERTAAVTAALRAGFASGNHQQWILLLLQGYYDPMYDYQLAKKAHRVVFRGPAAAVRTWLEAQAQLHPAPMGPVQTH